MGRGEAKQFVSLSMIILVVTVTALTVLHVPVGAESEKSEQSNVTDQNAGSDAGQTSDAAIPEDDLRALAPLGAMTADGNSPGHIIGRSYHDNQGNLAPGRLVDWRHGPQMHFIFSGRYLPGDPISTPAIPVWYEYAMFDPSVTPNGLFLPMKMVQVSPLTTGGWFPNLDVDETGHAILAGETFDPPATPLVRDARTYWDVAGTANYGTFLPDQLPQALSLDPMENMEYPKMEYQEFGGGYVTHVVVKEPSGSMPHSNSITYWRRAGGNPTTGGWTMSVLTSTVSSNQFDIAASRSGSAEVAVCWIEWPNWYPTGAGDESGQIMVQESHDAGITWNPPYSITPDVAGQDTWVAWVDLCALYDTDDYLHVVYNAEEYDGSSGTKQSFDPSRILHWTNRVSGPYGGGTIRLVHMAEGLSHMCGQGRPWVTNTAKPSISQCDDKLYVVWQQYGDYDSGDTLDCADPTLTHTGAYMYNADLYMSVSSSLDGHLWDAGRNLTQSKTPGCDGSSGNNCDHDSYPSTSRYGMNTAAHAPTYWSAVSDVFQVRDLIAPAWADDDWYVDCIYVNDLMTEPVGHPDAPVNALWTHNPIKWFRLPCVAPVIAPDLYLIESVIEYPHYWADAGLEKIVDVGIENIGNATLNVSNIAIEMTVGNPAWLNVAPVTLSIPPGDTAYFQLTLNVGGAVIPAVDWESIIADIIVHSDGAGGSEDTVRVNTIVGPLAMWSRLTGFGLTQTITTGWVEVAPPGDFTFFGGLDMVAAVDGAIGPYRQPRGKKIEYIGGALNTFSIQDQSSASTPTRSAIAQGTLTGLAGLRPGPAQNVTRVGAIAELTAGVTPAAAQHLTNYAIVWALDPIVIGDEGIGPIEDPRTFDVDLSIGAETFINSRMSHLNFTALLHDGVYPDPDDLLYVIGPGDTLYDITVGQDNMGWVQVNVSYGDSENYEFSYSSEELESYIEHAITEVGDSVFFKEGLEVSIATVTVPGDIDNVTVGLLFESEIEEPVGCCGIYADLPQWPYGYTGNVNCSEDGKRNLSDITALICVTYYPVGSCNYCCYASANTSGDGSCKITLSDITKLIDAVYISRNITAPCNPDCER